MHAALRTIPIPNDVVARLFHAASLLHEHRGDGHIAVLMIEGVGGLEAHVLFALDMGMPAEKLGNLSTTSRPRSSPPSSTESRDRGLIGDDGWLSEQGHAVKQRVEALTDDLAAKPYGSLEPGEVDELMATLEPLAALLPLAAQDCDRRSASPFEARSGFDDVGDELLELAQVAALVDAVAVRRVVGDDRVAGVPVARAARGRARRAVRARFRISASVQACDAW